MGQAKLKRLAREAEQSKPADPSHVPSVVVLNDPLLCVAKPVPAPPKPVVFADDATELAIRRRHAELSRILLSMCRGLAIGGTLTPQARQSLIYWAGMLEDECRAIEREAVA